MRIALNIKARVTLWYIFILSVALVFLSLVSYFVLSHNINDRIHSPINPFYTQVMVENPTPALTDSTQNFVHLTTYSLGEGQVKTIQTEPENITYINSTFGIFSLNQKEFITSQVFGTQSVSVYGRLSQATPDILEILVVLQSTTATGDIMKAFAEVLYFTTPVTVLIAGVAGFFLVRCALRPIDVITRNARGIQAKNLNLRIPDTGNDELGKLSKVLNQTLDRVQKAFENERNFAADASHGLKTPLAIMQGEATLALSGGRTREEYQNTLISISTEISRLSSTIDRLLNLEGMDNDSSFLKFKTVNLNNLMSDIAEDIAILCETKGLNFNINGLESENAILIKGDVTKLRELFLNLADNAIKFTGKGGDVTLSLDCQRDFARIALKDTGIGISAEHIHNIFDRFYRAGESADETIPRAGLGLSLCKKIAEVHGGKIEVESIEGVGSTFTVLLPVEPDT